MIQTLARVLFVACACAAGLAAVAQDANVTLPVADLERMLASAPMRIVTSEISRPKAKGDITLNADVAFGDQPPLRVKVRKAEPGADTFNNVPRYDLAAYELQKFFVDPPEYLVPPTALRMLPLGEVRRYSPDVERTFPGAEDVLVVVQYWLHDIMVIADVYDPGKFASDPVYARHIGQLNVLTYLVEHRDSNAGNFLIARGEPGQRVFSIDHGVAFASPDSDRGMLWKDLRVSRLPADTVARLRSITRQALEDRLAVVAQWQVVDGHYVAVKPGANFSRHRGVRRAGDQVQMGLRQSEIAQVERLLNRLLERVDRGEITTF